MRIRTFLAVALFVGAFAAPVRAEGCAPAEHAGGDWPSYGQNLSNTRSQPDESVIGTGNVANLAPNWVFTAAGAGGAGAFQSTPAIAGGCAFGATDAGWIFALDADDGALIWKTQLDASGGQVPGIFGLTVADGRVHGGAADPDGAYAFALDPADGSLLWRTASDPELGEAVNASAVVADGIQLLAAWGEDANPEHHNAFALIDATDGTVLAKTFVVPPDQAELGYAGGGIWATAVVDTTTKHAYVGTANPYSKRREHPHTNAILKIDMDRSSETFGDIVDSYKGDTDNYLPGLYDQPVCELLGDEPALWYASYSAACLQLDIDFGGSPTMFTGPDGRPVIAELQKSGVLHATFGDTMERAWTALLAAPSLLGNAASVAFDGEAVLASANPGVLWSVGKDSGTPRWAGLTADAARYQPPSHANGVVYTVDGYGNVVAWDAATGAVLLRRSASTDAAVSGSLLSSAGVSIARNQVYVPVSGAIVSYGLPA